MGKTIGIIGANGQVGSEVSLLLSLMGNVSVVPICRNAIGATFLRRCGLNVRIGSVGDEKQSRALLAGLDLVADFSLPAGSSSEVRTQMTSVIEPLVRYAPSGAPFVYLSSILAYGNPDFRSPLKHYRISQNAYGSTKRFAENLTETLGRKSNRSVYLFRVGVVHGELQSVSRKIIQDIKDTAADTAFVPDCPSYTVFAFSIAEALVSALERRDEPGLYTLVSNPAWSWKELHEYFVRRAEVEQHVSLLQPDRPISVGLRGLAKPAFRLLKGYKEVINGYVGSYWPHIEQQLRATYHTRVAAAEINIGKIARQYRPYLNNHDVFPGKRLLGISDSRTTMHAAVARLRSELDLLANTG